MTEHIISVSPWFPPIDPLSHSFSKRRRTEGTSRTRRWNQCQGPGLPPLVPTLWQCVHSGRHPQICFESICRCTVDRNEHVQRLEPIIPL